jgi:hypothetical protein
VRKSLGRHEIATVQTTTLDNKVGVIRLTTVLAHSSGEWLSSDWPVCPIGDTAAPQRMGAALTYARRYALFTLVGIAGEDDLDAPDLTRSSTQYPEGGGSTGNRSGNGARASIRRTPPNDRKPAPGLNPILPPEESAALRERLIGEIQNVDAAEGAFDWAHRTLTVKNSLMRVTRRSLRRLFGSELHTLKTL